MRMAKNENMFEGLLLAAVSRRATEVRRDEHEALADMITQKVVTAWNKGQKKSK